MKTSVCIAAFNGERYLAEQLQSILLQLSLSDEVVVVDDCSKDGSVKVIQSIGDPRIRLVLNDENRGVLATFDRALNEATGEVLFLCDQDDIWRPDKVQMVLAAFASDPRVTMVASDAQVIDATGNIVAKSFFEQRGAFSSGILHTLVKNKYLGCTMAFRRIVLPHFLPIPRDVPMHDMWFGLMNEVYGRVAFIDQPLISYRRHGGNVSPSAGSSLGRRLVWRWRLVKNLAARVFRDSFCRIK